MNTENKFQLDIMQKFNQIKNEYIELKLANKNLEEAIELLKKRLTKKEKQRTDLITMFKKIVNQNKIKIESLQKENNHLQGTIQEQNQTIEENLNIIDELREKVQIVTEKNTNYDNDKEIYLNLPTTIHNNNKVINDGKINSNNFTHPSFNTEAKMINKNQKKPRVVSHFRWPNLDIMINGGNKVEKNGNHIDTANEKQNQLFKFEKRRKLYCPDDATVDLENED